MSKELVVAVICLIVAMVTIGIAVYMYIRDNTLEDIRDDAYQLFLRAEHDLESEIGLEKMRWVLRQIHNIMPSWARYFITEATLEYIVQRWFDSVKDLLDDGKYNKSAKE